MTSQVCRVVCWLLAVALGVLAGYGAGASLGLPTVLAVPLAIGVFWVISSYLPGQVCSSGVAQSAATPAPEGTATTASAASAPASPAPKAAESTPLAVGGHWSDAVSAESGRASAERGQSALKPSQALSEEEVLRDGVGSWRFDGSDAKTGDAVASTSAAGAAGAKPSGLSAPRGGGADDLTVIKGIGKKVEQALNAMGIFHLDQIASWSGAEAAWVDAELPGFKGRVSRDHWVDQAKDLTRGGAAR